MNTIAKTAWNTPRLMPVKVYGIGADHELDHAPRTIQEAQSQALRKARRAQFYYDLAKPLPMRKFR